MMSGAKKCAGLTADNTTPTERLARNTTRRVVEARTILCTKENRCPVRNENFHIRIYAVSVLICLLSSLAWSQGEGVHLGELLKDEILSPAVADFQMRQHIVQGIAPLPKVPATPAEWTASADQLRRHLVNDVVFHGWPKQWVDSPPKFEERGVIETGHGYRIRKLRFEVVPGFYSSGLLYEPEHIDGTVPAILSLSGHDGPLGYSYEFKQKRCITFAKHGILALNLEWFAFGELSKEGNDHSFAAHLDLAGANGLGLFYLEMRRGLDYLYLHPHVDRKRIGVTGLSGGGWQTIVLSSLDERVKAANPVAGFAATSSRVEAKEFGDMGDIEQSATDFLRGSDYPYLVALMAPRPILLTYNGEDDCCFRASLAKPRIFDAIQPFFGLYGKADNLNWHENRDPGDHNYQLENRLADYSFFTKHFGLPPILDEAGIPAELRSYEELVTALPEDNLTILGLARQLGREITRSPIPTAASRESGLGNLGAQQTQRDRPVSTGGTARYLGHGDDQEPGRAIDFLFVSTQQRFEREWDVVAIDPAKLGHRAGDDCAERRRQKRQRRCRAATFQPGRAGSGARPDVYRFRVEGQGHF